MDTTKYCPHCDRDLPVSAFNRCARKASGLQTYCRECQKATFASHYASNHEHQLMRVKAYRQEHREKCLKQMRDRAKARREADPEGYREQCKAAYRANPKRHNARNAASYQRHRIKRMQTARAWAHANPEKVNQAHRKWVQANPLKCIGYGQRRRAREHNTQIEDHIDYEGIWKHDKGVCHICRLPVERSQCHFDHVIPLARNGTHTTANLSVSHPTCNRRKGTKLMSEL